MAEAGDGQGSEDQGESPLFNDFVKRFHCEIHNQLRTYLADFMAAYNLARGLKMLSGLTPDEYIAKIWTSEPDRFIVDRSTRC